MVRKYSCLYCDNLINALSTKAFTAKSTSHFMGGPSEYLKTAQEAIVQTQIKYTPDAVQGCDDHD